MRSVVVVAMVLAFTASARADGSDADLAHTRAVLRRHAAGSRTVRTITGVAFITGGIAYGGAGYYIAATAKEGGWIDLSAIDKAFGYTMLFTGVIAIAGGIGFLVRDTPYEKMRDEVSSAEDARFARTEIAHNAADARHSRSVVRILGLTVVGVSAAGITVALAADDRLDRDLHNGLLGSGIVFGVLGAGFLASTLIESRWEQMHRDLESPRVPVTAGLIPVRGGAVVGVGGSF